MARTTVMLDVARRNWRAFHLGGIHIDETDMQPREGLSALHIDDIRYHARTIGQMAAIRPREGASNIDILNGITVVVAKRHCHKGVGAEASPAPGLRRDRETIERRRLLRHDRLRSCGIEGSLAGQTYGRADRSRSRRC